MRKLVLSAALATALLVQAAQAQETVTIGIVTAQTGPLAAAGKFQMNGFNLAVEQINKTGFDVAGKNYKLGLKVYDTHCSTSEGAAAMQRLVSVDQVSIVLGELCSPVVSAEAPLAQDEKVPLIITVPTAVNLTEQNNPYLFRINAHNGQLTTGLVDYIKSVDSEPLAAIAWNNDAGRGGVNGVKALLPKDYKLGYIGYFNVNEVDFSNHITNIRNSGAKSVLLLMDEEPGALAIRQIRDAGLKVQFIGTLAMGSDRFLTALNAKYLDGMVQYSSFPPNAPIDRIKKFNDAYRAKFNEESHGFAAQSYDAVFASVEAMKAAGKVKGGPAIRDALSAISFDGVIGKIAFDKKGQASPPVYITQWCENGTRKVIFPKDMIAACGGG
jgi:branched-chain amino acid transport system substrate-binding protein